MDGSRVPSSTRPKPSSLELDGYGIALESSTLARGVDKAPPLEATTGLGLPPKFAGALDLGVTHAPLGGGTRLPIAVPRSPVERLPDKLPPSAAAAAAAAAAATLAPAASRRGATGAVGGAVPPPMVRTLA